MGSTCATSRLPPRRRGNLRRFITTEIRRLGSPSGRVLHAAYAGTRWPGTDIENVLFNNIDQTLALFANVARHGVSFEDGGPDTPPSPSGTRRSSHYAYGLHDPGESFCRVVLGDLACHIEEITVEDGAAGLATRIWLALVRSLPPDFVTLDAPQSYALRVKARGLNPGTTVKAIVDGASAAMQAWTVCEDVNACALGLEPLVSVSRDELVGLLTPPRAPLGTARRLFTVHRTTGQIRVTPDDERCVAAEVIALSNEPPPRLSVDLYAVAHHPVA